MIEIRRFDELTVHQLYEVLQLRSEVFVVEQNCIYQDLDGNDQNSYHVICTEENALKSYCRIFWKKDEKNVIQLGRMVSADKRKGYGIMVLNKAVEYSFEQLKADEIYLEAQCYAKPFYIQAGFTAYGEEFLEDGIPHICMRRKKNANV